MIRRQTVSTPLTCSGGDDENDDIQKELYDSLFPNDDTTDDDRSEDD